MSWVEIKKSYNLLIRNTESDDFFVYWKKFKSLVEESKDKEIYITKFLLSGLKNINKNKKTIHILDHGCGNGLKSIYLLALGYNNIYGINVNDEVSHLNEILLKVKKKSKPSFFKTNGTKLPFSNNTFDYIISCQVLEHVKDDIIDIYYKEEGRVLKNQGYAYHEVPHLLVPYDSHSRLWFAHWAPKILKPLFYGVLKSLQQKKNLLKDGKYYAKKFGSDFLCLRHPNFHRKKLKKYIGDDIQEPSLQDRIINNKNMKDLDADSSKMLRSIINKVIGLPLIGQWISKVLKNFLMLHTLTRK